MKFRGQAALWLLLLLVLRAAHVSAQPASRIDNSGADTVPYCNGPVAVAPGISIENIDFENASDGIKISIANYKQGEDKLSYTGNKFSSNWDGTYGNLELTGAGTDEEYEEAIKKVFYENTSNNPTSEPRSFSITLLDADYLPYTDHFYQYIEKVDITWKEARDSAANMEYFGLQGYLATITSSTENGFIWSKIDGVGWIGASDEAQEGVWRWVTGPEAGTHFWQGTYQNGYTISGRFSYWSEGEPNNSGPEHFAHINQAPGKRDKSWNDLRNESDGPNSQYYRSQGFVVEFGDMAGDPDVQLSASAVVAFSPKPEVEVVDFVELMCGENSQQLLLQTTENVSTILRSLNSFAWVDEELTMNPVIQIEEDEYGNYSFEIETIDQNSCSWLDTIEVNYQHQPTAEFFMDSTECKGYNLQLSFEGEVLSDATFDWYSNDTIFYSGVNVESLEIPLGYGTPGRSVGLRVNEKGCVDSTKIDVTVTPVLDFTANVFDGCTPLETRLIPSSSEPIDEYDWEFGDGSSSVEKQPAHTYENNGTTDKSYDVFLRIVSAEGCENSGTKRDFITVHPTPTLGFDFNENNCYSENAIVNYAGSASERDTFLWDLSDFQPGEISQNPGYSTGPLKFLLANRPQVEIGLHVVSEFGCTTDSISQTYLRKPIFDVSSNPVEGCPPVELSMELTSTDSIDNVDYFWNLGEGKTSNGKLVEATYSFPDNIYDLEIIAQSSTTGCNDTLLLPGKVKVYPVPQAAFSANPANVFVSDPVVDFTNQSEGAVSYQWDFDDSSPLSEEATPVHAFNDMGFYKVMLTASNEFGCVDTTSSNISVVFDKLFPPNAFSPNAARDKDREFRIYSEGVVDEGYHLLIFNRWGETIFESNSQQTGWDGKMNNGNYAPAGTYTWIIKYFDFTGKKHNQQGTVTLLF